MFQFPHKGKALDPLRTAARKRNCRSCWSLNILRVRRAEVTKNDIVTLHRNLRTGSRAISAHLLLLRIAAVIALAVAITERTSAADRGSTERTFVKALGIFDAAQSKDDFRESATLLETILSEGFRSGVVYYNLGNAYFRSGDYGRAILNYRKARPYRPRDPYLLANLQQALSVAPGHLPEPSVPWWSHVLFWNEWLSLPTKMKVASIGFSLAAMTMALAVCLCRPRLHAVTVALLAVSSAMAIDARLSYVDAFHSRRAVITGETMALKGIGKDYEPAFDQPLRDGAEFFVLSETSDWVFGHFEGIGDGWIRSEYVAR